MAYYDASEYQNSYNDDFSGLDFRLHILDYLILVICFVLLFVPTIIGFLEQSTLNKVAQKDQDINQVIKALDSYFVASDSYPEDRKYPISNCSGQPNEVDYEYTLKNHLAGKVTQLNNFAYIKENDFPKDPFGIYSVRNNERKIKLRNCDQVFKREDNNDLIYDSGSSSCNFQRDSKNESLRSCYLYGSDNRGSQYQLAYYDENLDKYVVYTKIRNTKLVKTLIAR
jgi:hypothetical protein